MLIVIRSQFTPNPPVFTATAQLLAINPNRTKVVTANHTLTHDVPGNWKAKASVDWQNSVLESNAEHNFTDQGFTIGQ